jgi:hypothetical protein
MSEPKRYEPSSHYSADFGMAQSPVGKWVRYEDHAQLMADLPKMVAWGRGLEHDKRLLQEENARLKAEVDAWKDMVTDSGVACNELHAENLRLKAEIDRLKAETIKQIETAMPPIENYIAQLEAKVEQLERKLKDEKSANSNAECIQQDVLRGLRRKVERMTKAGDALAGEAIRLEYNNYWSEYERVEDVCIDEVEAWHKAKGVQS